MKKKILIVLSVVALMICSTMFFACNSDNNPSVYVGSNKDEVVVALEGDIYIDETNGDLYKFTADGWTLISTLKGEQGEKGADGINGVDGKDGINGVNGVNGVDGKDGKDGLNGLDGKDGVGLVNVEFEVEVDKYGQTYLVFTFYYDNETTTVSKYLIPEKQFAGSYEALKNSIDNANDGDVINLVDDIIIDGDCDLVVTKEITIELNGHNISAPNDTLGNGIFRVVEGGKLTINGEGTIDGVNATEYAMAIWVDGGEVVINGGTYTNLGVGEDSQYDLVYVKNGGKLTINGGEFICKTPKWTLNLNDENGGEIVVMGGKFICYNPSKATTEKVEMDFVPVGYFTDVVLEADGTWYALVTEIPEVLE